MRAFLFWPHLRSLSLNDTYPDNSYSFRRVIARMNDQPRILVHLEQRKDRISCTASHFDNSHRRRLSGRWGKQIR